MQAGVHSYPHGNATVRADTRSGVDGGRGRATEIWAVFELRGLGSGNAFAHNYLPRLVTCHRHPEASFCSQFLGECSVLDVQKSFEIRRQTVTWIFRFPVTGTKPEPKP